MNSCYDPAADEDIEFEVPELEVEVTSDGVIGTILGPDGEPLRTVRRPFGFTRPQTTDPGRA